MPPMSPESSIKPESPYYPFNSKRTMDETIRGGGGPASAGGGGGKIPEANISYNNEYRKLNIAKSK